MKRIICTKCGRYLLSMAYGQIEVTCTNSKCKHTNKIKLTTYKQLLTADKEQITI